jgi:hypothetical protein
MLRNLKANTCGINKFPNWLWRASKMSQIPLPLWDRYSPLKEEVEPMPRGRDLVMGNCG